MDNTMLRHVARIANTDQRCVVAFMQIPGREDHALVVPVDNLPPRMEQAVMDVLRSPEGQNEETFALALSRNLLPDTGQDILKTLHATGRLVAVPVGNVLMMPRPNNPVKLSTVLEQLGRLPDQQSKGLMEDYALNKFNPHVNNQKAHTNEQNRSIARNLIVEAEMLEADAKRKREQAYGYDPSMRPSPMNGHAYEAASELPLPELHINNWQVEETAQPEPLPEPQPDHNAELMQMMSKLMAKVDEQDRTLQELQTKTERPEKRRRTAS